MGRSLYTDSSITSFFNRWWVPASAVLYETAESMHPHNAIARYNCIIQPTIHSSRSDPTMQSARCNPHDAIRTMQSAWCNPHDAIRTIQSHNTIRTMRSHDAIRTMRSYHTIHIMRSYDAIRTMSYNPHDASLAKHQSYDAVCMIPARQWNSQNATPRHTMQYAGQHSYDSVDPHNLQCARPTSMLRMVVGDPEPTPQRQKLSLPTRQGPGAKWVRNSGGWEKQTSYRCAGVVLWWCEG